MPDIIDNPWCGCGLDIAAPDPASDVRAVQKLLAFCPAHSETPLLNLAPLADHLGLSEIMAKDERSRMGLGSFKALGAAFAIAKNAAGQVGDGAWSMALAGQTYVTASAGNHGLSVAAGAQLFGAQAVIYLAETVPAAFAARLEAKGATVVRAGADYEASMVAAGQAAVDQGWTLLSDSSWPGYFDLPHAVMEGYLQLVAEAALQTPHAPTHIVVQAGVGGLAGAVAAHARYVWGDGPEITVVEPAYAPALFESIKAGRAVETTGPVSDMGRLDCKTPSLIALKGLSRDADRFALITEEEAQEGVALLARYGIETTPSGGAGFAAVSAGLGLGPESRVLIILSEGAEDG